MGKKYFMNSVQFVLRAGLHLMIAMQKLLEAVPTWQMLHMTSIRFGEGHSLCAHGLPWYRDQAHCLVSTLQPDNVPYNRRQSHDGALRTSYPLFRAVGSWNGFKQLSLSCHGIQSGSKTTTLVTETCGFFL